MIDHVWTVLCSRSVIDSERNNISLLDVIEQINVVGPAASPGNVLLQSELVSLWARSEPKTPASGQGRARLVGPDGKQLTQTLFPIDLSAFERLRTRAAITVLPIYGSGRYWVVVDLRENGEEVWKEVAKVPVNVVYEVQASAAMASPPPPNAKKSS
jgi:hypothetical protein